MNSKILKTAEIFYQNDLAGYLYKTEEGYTFIYHDDFLKKNIPIALSF